ncbi:MAG TPA: hypothetical protein VEQ11_20010 [Chloroflexota bacterium]|nr:hypothetical protein [Chloroflexota bacterium]
MITATRYDLVAEPSGDMYDRLLAFASRHAASFSLVLTRASRTSESALAALGALQQFEIGERETSEWPGTELMAGHTAVLHMFRCDVAAIETLKRLARRLYAWQSPLLPDDLCFYRVDGAWLMTSTAHEEAADLVLTESEYQEVRELVPELRLEQVLVN